MLGRKLGKLVFDSKPRADNYVLTRQARRDWYIIVKAPANNFIWCQLQCSDWVYRTFYQCLIMWTWPAISIEASTVHGDTLEVSKSILVNGLKLTQYSYMSVRCQTSLLNTLLLNARFSRHTWSFSSSAACFFSRIFLAARRLLSRRRSVRVFWKHQNLMSDGKKLFASTWFFLEQRASVMSLEFLDFQ